MPRYYFLYVDIIQSVMRNELPYVKEILFNDI